MGDLSVTALYTSGAWSWGGVRGAECLASDDAKRVFRVTNAALRLARPWSPPSLPHALLWRHALIDFLLAQRAPTKVLELASGFSPRGLSASENPLLTYVEIDRPAVIERKRSLLARSTLGKEALERSNWQLLSSDVIADSFEAQLGSLAPQLVMAEGLFMYLDVETQRSLQQRIAAMLAPGGTLI